MSEVASDTTYATLGTALADIQGPTHIHIGEGSHVVDNPIVLRKAGTRIVGRGRDRTILVPRHAGREVIRVDAADVAIEAFSIDGLSSTTRAPVTFAVLLNRSVTRCAVRDIRINNTGATAVLGHGISECDISGNLIIAAGDDGIQLRGDRLLIARNRIIGYLDEAIDVAGGDTIVVRENTAARGRIGMAIDGPGLVVLEDNVVDDHREVGVHIPSTGGAIVRGNRIRNAGTIAYLIEYPQDVSDNSAVGSQRVGIRLLNAMDASFRRNLVEAMETAFDFPEGAPSDRGENLDCSAREDPDAGDGGDGGDGGDAGDAGDADATGFRSECVLDWTPHNGGDHTAADDVGLVAPSWFSRISGESAADRRIAEDLSRFLGRWNPGFVSIHVNGRRMRSEITRDLHGILDGAGTLAIGLVRMPVRKYHWATGNAHPVWHLSVGGEDVAIVSYRDDGPGARLRLLKDGRLTFTEAVGFRAERFLTGLRLRFRAVRDGIPAFWRDTATMPGTSPD